MMTVSREAPNALSLRLVAAGRDIQTVYISPGTSLGNIVAEYRDENGQSLTSKDGTMEYFVNGASVNLDYTFEDDNQMLIVVGAVFNG